MQVLNCNVDFVVTSRAVDLKRDFLQHEAREVGKHDAGFLAAERKIAGIVCKKNAVLLLPQSAGRNCSSANEIMALNSNT